MMNMLETTPFGATSTTDDVLSGVNLKGKRILRDRCFGWTRRGNGALPGRPRRSGCRRGTGFE